MPRRTAILYPHEDHSIPEEDEDDQNWPGQSNVNARQSVYGSQSTVGASPSSIRSRHKTRPKNSLSGLNSTSGSSSAKAACSPLPSSTFYLDMYSQFVSRYRSAPGMVEDPRNDPESHYFQRGLGQLVDAGDSDEEDIGLNGTGNEIKDRFSAVMLETGSDQLRSLQDKERLEWQTMLASVLGGDVLKSEKTRIAVALESSAEEHNNRHMNIWLEIRAKFHGISDEEERKTLEERRVMLVDSVIEEVQSFRVKYANDVPNAIFALKQVNAVLRRLDIAHSLYPSLKAFYADKPAASQSDFLSRCDTLNTWSTVYTALRRQISYLRWWTGSEDLDVTQPYTNAEIPITSTASRAKNGHAELVDGTNFVERVLKEDSIQRTFEKGFLTTVHVFIGRARDAQVNLSALFQEMNLPTFENELVPLISFPTKLAQASLRVRLAYVDKLRDPEILIIDQVLDDLKLNIGLACTLKRQYEAFLSPDPGGQWNLPPCISGDYEATILEALTVFFKLIHWKLKSGSKGVYFKETDLLEAHWATFNDVSATTSGGSSVVAEQLCALTNKLMVRVTNYFETQVRVPMSEEYHQDHTYHEHLNGYSEGIAQGLMLSSKKMSDEQMVGWYEKILDGVRLRYRKLQRFARVLTQRFSNSAEYNLEDVPLEHFISTLVATDHFLVYTQSFEEDGTYIVAPRNFRDRPNTIRRIFLDSFHANDADDDFRVVDNPVEVQEEEDDEPGYLLVLSPRSQFLWNGLVLMLELPQVDLDLKDNRVRLISDGPQRRLVIAKQHFSDLFMPVDEDGSPLEPVMAPLTCLMDQQAHLPIVNRELRKISRATNRLAESIADSVHHVRNSLRKIAGCQELLANWYSFASEHGQHAQKFMDRTSLHKFNRLLIKLAISWVSFICDDCDPTDRRTFKWAVNALEFTLHRTRRNNILSLPDGQFQLLRQKVASCMTLLISHFDILGARSTLEAKREKERQEELLRQQASHAELNDVDDFARSITPDNEEDLVACGPYPVIDPVTRMYWERVSKAAQELDRSRAAVGTEQRVLGRVLDDEKPEDRSLVFLASSSSNISVRWQQRRLIGAGAFGSVYLAANLDSGTLMAVKEIKFQQLSGLPNLYAQIRDELSVMEMLHHPNVVEYYGIEVHRDKVYIFEEYCQGGSLAALLEHGRIEDEGIIQVYTMQMLEGLAYLHSKGIVHRDIKPDNILLDHLGVIKFVDFGAAKILAKNQRTIQRSRRGATDLSAAHLATGGLGLNNSLTGTPMYMSPEIIKNDKRGRHGAMDIWSLGCVVLEFATGRKPWSNLDNEWAIMFHIGVATQHPPLPEPGQLSELGINFIKQCLTIDPTKRPTALELMNHPWILAFREALRNYEEQELATSPPAEMPPEEKFETASVARQAAIIQEKEMEAIISRSPSTSPLETPSSGSDSAYRSSTSSPI